MDHLNCSPVKCFMCGLSHAESKSLLGGLDGFICESCVRMASEVLRDRDVLAQGSDGSKEATQRLFNVLTPEEIQTLQQRFAT